MGIKGSREKNNLKIKSSLTIIIQNSGNLEIILKFIHQKQTEDEITKVMGFIFHNNHWNNYHWCQISHIVMDSSQEGMQYCKEKQIVSNTLRRGWKS